MTGCAGFIGSHLTEALLSDGISVIGVDCFNDNYGRREKLRNLETAREWDHFDFVPGRPQPRRAARPRGRSATSSSTSPPSRACGRAGASLRPVPAQQRARHTAAARGDARRPGQALRVRLLVVDLRRGGGPPDARGHHAAPALAVRDDEARRRAPLLALPRQPRRRCRVPALLLGVRPAPAPGHGVQHLLPGGAERASRSRSSATAARRATSPTSPTWSRPRARRRHRGRGRPGVQRRRRLADRHSRTRSS